MLSKEPKIPTLLWLNASNYVILISGTKKDKNILVNQPIKIIVAYMYQEESRST